MNPMKEDDTQEILSEGQPTVQTPGPPIDDGCQGLPTAAGEYTKTGTRNADGSCTISTWTPK